MIVDLFQQPPSIQVRVVVSHLVDDVLIAGAARAVVAGTRKTREVHPRINGEIAAGDVQAVAIAEVNVGAAGPVQAERLSDFAGGIGCAPVGDAVVTADDVGRISVARPPVDHIGRRGSAARYAGSGGSRGGG